MMRFTVESVNENPPAPGNSGGCTRKIICSTNVAETSVTVPSLHPGLGGLVHNILGGGFKHFLFSPLFGEDYHFD